MKDNILKKRIAFLACMVIGIAQAQAQDPAWEWVNINGDIGDEISRDITVDAAGNIYTTGSFQGTVDFNAGAGVFNMTTIGYKDIFIMKTDAAGGFQWAKQLGAVDEGNEAYSIAVDDSGNVYTTGVFNGKVNFNTNTGGVYTLTSAGAGDIFVSKLSTSGDFLWATQMGGAANDEGYSITTDSSGQAYVTGYFTGNANFGTGKGQTTLTATGASDVFIAKLSKSGDLLWAKKVGGKKSDFGHTVATDAFQNVYIKGTYQDTADFNPGSGTHNMNSPSATFVLKLNTEGEFVWVKQIEGALVLNNGRALALDACSNLYMTGTFTGTVDFDPDNTTQNLTKNGSGGEAFVLKWNSAGNFAWVKSLGGATADIYPAALALDVNNNIYTTGFYKGTADFDPGTTDNYITAFGGNDIYVSKLDGNGAYIWAGQLGGSGYEYATTIGTDDYSNIYVSGYFEEPVDFNPSASAVENRTPIGAYDIYLVKLSGSKPGAGGDIPLVISGPDSVCAYQVYTYTVNDFPATSFNWELPTGWTGNSNSATITVTTNGEAGILSVTANRACDTLEQQLSLELRLPSVSITVDGSVLGTTHSDSYTSWQWYLEGKPINAATDSTYTVTANGIYSVVVTGNGCTDTATYTVNNTSIGQGANTIPDLKIYPNPVKNTLHLHTTQPLTLNITGVDGRVLQSTQIAVGDRILNLERLPQGIYLLNITNAEGLLIKTEKIIKIQE